VLLPRWPKDFESRLASHAGPEAEDPPSRRAAVAVIFRAASSSDILLMRRAEHPGDPWSGQISLPGGRHELEDPDLLATAARETREEVGIDLFETASTLCRLAPVRARARGTLMSMDVTPYVFRMDRSAQPEPGPEASEVFWFPLERVLAGELDGEHSYRRDQVIRRLPCWDFEGRTIWGMTYFMLCDVLRAGGIEHPHFMP